jgi:hypothetical protein
VRRHPRRHDEVRVVADNDKGSTGREEPGRLGVELAQRRKLLVHQRAHHHVVARRRKRRGTNVCLLQATVEVHLPCSRQHLRGENDAVDDHVAHANQRAVRPVPQPRSATASPRSSRPSRGAPAARCPSDPGPCRHSWAAMRPTLLEQRRWGSPADRTSPSRARPQRMCGSPRLALNACRARRLTAGAPRPPATRPPAATASRTTYGHPMSGNPSMTSSSSSWPKRPKLATTSTRSLPTVASVAVHRSDRHRRLSSPPPRLPGTRGAPRSPSRGPGSPCLRGHPAGAPQVPRNGLTRSRSAGDAERCRPPSHVENGR